MKPTVKSFLALAGDKELTVHIARYKSDSADGYSDEEVFVVSQMMFRNAIQMRK